MMPEIAPLLDVVFILLIFLYLYLPFLCMVLICLCRKQRLVGAVSGRIVEVCLKKDRSIYAEKNRIARDDLKFFIHKI